MSINKLTYTFFSYHSIITLTERINMIVARWPRHYRLNFSFFFCPYNYKQIQSHENWYVSIIAEKKINTCTWLYTLLYIPLKLSKPLQVVSEFLFVKESIDSLAPEIKNVPWTFTVMQKICFWIFIVRNYI